MARVPIGFRKPKRAGRLKAPRAYDASGIPLHFDGQSIFKERICRDQADSKLMHDEITVIDHALTRPWTVDKKYTLNPNHRSATKMDLYSTTSSASANSEGGIVRPGAVAVLRLTTRLNLSGVTTGNSPGLAPRRMREPNGGLILPPDNAVAVHRGLIIALATNVLEELKILRVD
jgi:hypothetical protein